MCAVLSLALVALAGCVDGKPGPPGTTAPTGGAPASATMPPVSFPGTSAKAAAVPNVVGMNHQKAQDAMQAAGFYFLTEEDATGRGRLLINDSNWVVVEQVPAAGTVIPQSDKILLRSKKKSE
ncbi:PASTA domain-containing protein [Actinokineospora auranticolor]|nr:PASTA domain-containing protein [Actinokineospora auranticolor]